MSEANPSPRTVLVYPQNQEEDEINLFELFQIIAARKTLIFTITILFTITSAIAVSLMPKTWNTSTNIILPTQEDIESFTIAGVNDIHYENKGIENISYQPSSVYDKFSSTFQSPLNKQAFFEQKNITQYYTQNQTTSKDKTIEKVRSDAAFQSFNQSLSLRKKIASFEFFSQNETSLILSGQDNVGTGIPCFWHK